MEWFAPALTVIGAVIVVIAWVVGFRIASVEPVSEHPPAPDFIEANLLYHRLRAYVDKMDPDLLKAWDAKLRLEDK